MRDYARVSPAFWTGDTGRALRKAGTDAQLMALYVLTCPSANMIGLYYLPLPTIAFETGMSIKGASKALERLSCAGFAYFDFSDSLIWVPQMARYQIGD